MKSSHANRPTNALYTDRQALYISRGENGQCIDGTRSNINNNDSMENESLINSINSDVHCAEIIGDPKVLGKRSKPISSSF